MQYLERQKFLNDLKNSENPQKSSTDKKLNLTLHLTSSFKDRIKNLNPLEEVSESEIIEEESEEKSLENFRVTTKIAKTYDIYSFIKSRIEITTSLQNFNFTLQEGYILCDVFNYFYPNKIKEIFHPQPGKVSVNLREARFNNKRLYNAVKALDTNFVKCCSLEDLETGNVFAIFDLLQNIKNSSGKDLD
ncbi:MAG: hypothetical protein MHPSP_000722 [Paramarteilia canceri]